MVKNSNEISGKAMAVIIGAILLLTPWFTKLGFSIELFMIIMGIVLIYLGVRE